MGTFIMKEVTQVTHHQLRDHGVTFHRQSTPSYHVLLQILVVLVWKGEIVDGLLLQQFSCHHLQLCMSALLDHKEMPENQLRKKRKIQFI